MYISCLVTIQALLSLGSDGKLSQDIIIIINWKQIQIVPNLKKKELK